MSKYFEDFKSSNLRESLDVNFEEYQELPEINQKRELNITVTFDVELDDEDDQDEIIYRDDLDKEKLIKYFEDLLKESAPDNYIIRDDYKINTGIIKEFTGGDYFYTYSNSYSHIPEPELCAPGVSS